MSRALLLSMTLSVLLTAVAPSSAAGADAPLGKTGRWITDARGRVVVLHGLNQINKLPPYAPDAIGFGADDARFIARQGFNTMRIGPIYTALEPEPRRFDRAYLERIARTQRQLANAGIFTLVDFHQDQYNERFEGEGFADWATIDDGCKFPKGAGFPGNYFVNVCLWRAYDNFWSNRAPAANPGVGLQDSFVAAWRRVAERFSREPMVFGYDIFNEPFPGSEYPTCANPNGCPLHDRNELTPFHRKAAAAIRRADPEKTIFYEPNVTFNSGADTHHGPIGDPNAGFSFHIYCLGSTPGLPTVPASDQPCRDLGEKIVFDNAERHAASTNTVPLITEFGATDDLAAIERIVDEADRRMMSWQEWAYWNRDVCCERPDEGLIKDLRRPPTPDNLDQEKLDVLVRAFPRTVAGTPEHFHFDRAAKTFDLAYSTRRADGRGAFGRCAVTEVFVPLRHFGRDYGVRVTGAEVISRPGAQRLRLVARPGAERISVRLTDKGSAPARSRRCDPRLRLRASPRRIRAGVKRRVTFKVTARGRRVAGARVSFAGRRVRTNRAGRARIVVRIRRAGRYRAFVRKPEHRSGRAAVRVLRARARAEPRLTG